jgi:hypothetical protein
MAEGLKGSLRHKLSKSTWGSVALATGEQNQRQHATHIALVALTTLTASATFITVTCQTYTLEINANTN